MKIFALVGGLSLLILGVLYVSQDSVDTSETTTETPAESVNEINVTEDDIEKADEDVSEEDFVAEPSLAGSLTAEPFITEPPPAELAEPIDSPPKSKTIEKLALALAAPKRWLDIYQGLSVGGVLQNTAANLVLIEVSGNAFRFELDINNSGMYEDSHQQRLAGALSDYFGQPVTAEIEVGSVVAETPLAYRERLRLERQAAAVDNLKQDINVRRIQDVFGGVLLENTVKPID